MSKDAARWTWRQLDADDALATWTALSAFIDWPLGRYDFAHAIPRCWYRRAARTRS